MDCERRNMRPDGERQGQLTCIGTGMLLGGHMLPRSRAALEAAEVVFVLVSDALVELWLKELRPDAISLQPFYAEGKSRRQSYDEMVARIHEEVSRGRDVCAVFYGHPGVFASVPHRALAAARDAGFPAFMEPGISAEDCLYADLGIDPGSVGCQHYEASQFLFYQRRIDPSAYLVLWQIGVVGDRSLRRTGTTAEHRSLLLDRLLEDYPTAHGVVAYEASTLPIQAPKIERFVIEGIVTAVFSTATTLVIPPARPLVWNQEVMDRIRALDAQSSV
jgi:hypothetical protein